MKATGVVRRIDDLGRVVIPKEIRKVHRIKEGDPLEIFTDKGDVVIDPVAGSGSTLRASFLLGRSSYGFEIEKKFYKEAKEKMLTNLQIPLF